MPECAGGFHSREGDDGRQIRQGPYRRPIGNGRSAVIMYDVPTTANSAAGSIRQTRKVICPI